MTKQSEDTLFEVYTKVDAEGIRKEFDRQLKNINGKICVNDGSTRTIR